MHANFFLDAFSTLHFGAIGLLVAALFHGRLRAAFATRCVGTATAVDLAWVRIVTCAVLIIYVLFEDLGSYARLGSRWFHWPGHLEGLGRGVLKYLLASETHAQVFSWTVVVALALAMLGVLTRVTVPLAAILYVVLAGILRGTGKYFHEGYLGMYVLFALCFLPSGDAWSMDERWRRRGRTADQPATTDDASLRYGWAVYACYAAASVPYLQLAFSKLAGGGLFWFDGRSLRNYMFIDELNLRGFDLAIQFPHTPVMLFTIAGFFALLIELTYAMVLVVPRSRLILPACVGLLHLSVWLTQDALFIDAVLIPLIFVRPSRWVWSGRWPQRAS